MHAQQHKVLVVHSQAADLVAAGTLADAPAKFGRQHKTIDFERLDLYLETRQAFSNRVCL